MFTGLVEEVGTVRAVRRGSHSSVLSIAAAAVLSDLRVGDSVAVNGVCLTATGRDRGGFMADVMHETLDRSTLMYLTPGSPVNLERALAAGSRFGGHIVSGHIDGVGRITRLSRDDNAVWYTVAAAPALLRYVVEKGSVALDGISLTVACVGPSDFSVSVIPHTAACTVLGQRRVGDRVNVETDLIGKYVEKLLGPQDQRGISMDYLRQNGF